MIIIGLVVIIIGLVMKKLNVDLVLRAMRIRNKNGLSYRQMPEAIMDPSLCRLVVDRIPAQSIGFLTQSVTSKESKYE